MSTLHPLGFKSALSVLKNGRNAFFLGPGNDLPTANSEQIAADDLLPQLGYVGSRYMRHRVLFLGINPGNGPRSCRSMGDQIALPALERFCSELTAASFIDAHNAYKSVCQRWPVWDRQCSNLLRAAGLDLDDIAFTNALPWRTNSKSAFGTSVAERAATLYVGPVLDELDPKVIVAIGKKAAKVLEFAGKLTSSVVVWNRAQALRPSVIAERNAASARFAELIDSRKGPQ